MGWGASAVNYGAINHGLRHLIAPQRYYTPPGPLIHKLWEKHPKVLKPPICILLTLILQETTARMTALSGNPADTQFAAIVEIRFNTVLVWQSPKQVCDQSQG